MVLWNFTLNQNLSCSSPSTTWSICVLLAFDTCSYGWCSWLWCSAVGCCRGCTIGITWTLCIKTEKKHFILINDAIFLRLGNIHRYFVKYYLVTCRSSCSRTSERIGVDATGCCKTRLAARTSWGSTLARIRGACIWRISITPYTTTKTLAYS